MWKKLLNFKYEFVIFVLFVLIRLPFLGHDNFNTDVWRWKSRIYDFGSGIFTAHFEKTLQMYHPGVTLMWIGTVAVKVYNLYYIVTTGANPPDNAIKTIFELDFVQNLFIVFVIGLTLTSVFYVLRKLFSYKFAFISVLLLTLEPFYSALTRVVHLEGLMSTFMLASFVWLYYFLETGQKKKLYVILSSFFTALALLTKSSSLYMLPFAGLTLFVWEFVRDRKILQSIKKSLLTYSKWLLVVMLFFFILWPAMWVVPQNALHDYFIGIFDVGVEGGHEQFYFNKFVEDPGPSFYFVVLWYRVSLLMLVGLVGYLITFKKFEKSKNNFALYLFMFLAFYFLEVSIPTKKLDRYLLPTIIGLSFISSIFYDYLLSKKYKKFIFIPVAMFIVHIGTALMIHPDYLSYFNPLGGGLKTGIYVLEPKWMIGQREVVNYFKGYLDRGEYYVYSGNESFYNVKKNEDKLTVAFPEKYYTQIWPFIREIGGWAILEGLAPEARRTNFFVYPVWDDFAYKKDDFKLTYVGNIKVRGVPVYNVYKRE